MISGAKKKANFKGTFFFWGCGVGGDCVTTRKTLGGGDNFCLVNTVHARLGGGLLVTAF